MTAIRTICIYTQDLNLCVTYCTRCIIIIIIINSNSNNHTINNDQTKPKSSTTMELEADKDWTGLDW